MSEVLFENNEVIFTDYNNNIRKLLNFDSFDNADEIVSGLKKTIDGHDTYFDEYFVSRDYIIFDSLLLRKYNDNKKEIKICILGADDGVLSYHVESITGMRKDDSLVTLVCNSIGNDNNNKYLETLLYVENLPQISLTISDYHKTNILNDYYDIVIINGQTNFLDPYAVIKEAERIADKSGCIIAFSYFSPLLESCFKTVFSEREEYQILPDRCILCTEKLNESWG